MAKSWIDDAWLRDAVDGDGNRIPPTAAMRRAAGADPEKAKKTIPPEHRTARYGKGSRWVVYWNAPDGRRRKAFRSRADAEAFRAGMEDDLRSGRYIDPRGGERTVADAYREWIGTLVNIKESTAAGYESAYRTTIGPKWAGTPLGAIDRSMVTAWVRDLLDGNAPGPLKGPLAALRVGDVRYRSRRIHITKTVTLQRDGRLGEGTPKNGKNRRVPIPGFLIRDLRELTDGRPADAYLFANAKGGRIHIGSWVRRIWHPALAAAGIRETPQARVTVHALRHSDCGGRRPEDAADHPRPFQRADHARPVRGFVARPDGPGQRPDRGDVRPTLPSHVPKMSPKRSRRRGRPLGNGLIPPFLQGAAPPSHVMYLLEP